MYLNTLRLSIYTRNVGVRNNLIYITQGAKKADPSFSKDVHVFLPRVAPTEGASVVVFQEKNILCSPYFITTLTNR